MLLTPPPYLSAEWFSYNPYFAGIADSKPFFYKELPCQTEKSKEKKAPVTGAKKKTKSSSSRSTNGTGSAKITKHAQIELPLDQG